MAGLYVHVPFCIKKCHYCDFVVTTDSSATGHRRFLSAIEREASGWRDRFQGTRFETLYLGGGTPSVLLENEMRELFSTVGNFFSFAENAEITLEANPGDVTKEKACLYRELGINRVSLGAQTFRDTTLKLANRAHDADAIVHTFESLREAGIRNINLDFILSLPGENVADVRHSLTRAVELGPEHVSLYELVMEERSAWGRLYKKNAAWRPSLPNENEQLEILSFAREFLKSHGYEHYELLNYARSGFRSRHNLLYWANAEYLGLGPGAFSYVDGRRFRLSEGVEDYFQKVEAGDFSAFEEETLSHEKKQIESFLLALRLAEGAEIAQFADIWPRVEGDVRRLEGRGDPPGRPYLIRDNGRVRLSPRGQLFAETVFTELC